MSLFLSLFSRRLTSRVGPLTLAIGLGVANPTISRSTTPIKPFIEPDAIAIGKSLVTQKLQDLVKTKKSASKPTKASQASHPSPNGSSNNPGADPLKLQRQLTAARHATPPPTHSDRLTIDSALEMRVALVKQADAVSIATSNGGAIVSLDSQGLKSLGPAQAYAATIGNSGLTIDGEPVPNAVWVKPDSGYVAVGDRWYRGRVLLLLREDGLYAINYVMLNEYLYSVVGAEMFVGWPIEALKAQAVAARSYALVHNVRHGGRDYDLDDTTRYQAYNGVMSEANTTHAAVQATAGEFISHNGGIVESLYAATQDIVNDAHSGFGMSQMGALDLAQQGYQYHQILGFYYPQTAIGRLDVSE